MYKGRIIAAYILLVGGPLLGLMGILRAGTRLSAAPVVRGNWTVETDFNLWNNLYCQALSRSAPQPLLSILQSGRDLTITLNNPEKTVLAGTISGSSTLAASSVARDDNESAQGGAGGCSGPRSLRLEARIHDSGKGRSLKGTLSVEGCADCLPMAFSAFKQSTEEKGAR